MEDIVDVESELTQRLSGLQKRLEKVALPDLSSKGDLGKVHELIKANLQRSKVIQDQIKESKVNIAPPPKCSRHTFMVPASLFISQLCSFLPLLSDTRA